MSQKVFSYYYQVDDTNICLYDIDKLRTIELIKYPDGRILKSVKIFKQFSDKGSAFKNADEEAQYWLQIDINNDADSDGTNDTASDGTNDTTSDADSDLDSDNKEKELYPHVLYFSLIYKLSDEEYLGILQQNTNMDTYEDNLVNININCVTEFSGHDEYIIEKQKGFFPTGVVGFIKDETMIYSINYDKIKWNNDI